MEDMEEKQARNNIVVGCNLKMLYDLLRHIFGDFSFPLFFEHIPALRGLCVWCVCTVFSTCEMLAYAPLDISTACAAIET